MAEDAGRPGATMHRRAGLQAALAEVKTATVDGIVVAKIDRLGRSSADVPGLVERAQREGWRLVALDVGLDTTTPAGELVAAALAMAARFEWRRISGRQHEKVAALRRICRCLRLRSERDGAPTRLTVGHLTVPALCPSRFDAVPNGRQRQVGTRARPGL
jgi:hypothetical protein